MVHRDAPSGTQKILFEGTWRGDSALRQISNVILMRGEKLLLGWRGRNRRAYANRWAVPGGHIEPGETPEQAGVREIQEELGVTVTDLHRLKPIDISNASGPVIFHMFAAWQWEGGEPSPRGDEHSKLRWFDVEQACRLDDLALDEYRASFRSLAQY